RRKVSRCPLPTAVAAAERPRAGRRTSFPGRASSLGNRGTRGIDGEPSRQGAARPGPGRDAGVRDGAATAPGSRFSGRALPRLPPPPPGTVPPLLCRPLRRWILVLRLRRLRRPRGAGHPARGGQPGFGVVGGAVRPPLRPRDEGGLPRQGPAEGRPGGV